MTHGTLSAVEYRDNHGTSGDAYNYKNVFLIKFSIMFGNPASMISSPSIKSEMVSVQLVLIQMRNL
jgi:hypothetical protein